MQNWLELFKFPAVERSTYDRLECTAKHQIYPVLGDKIVGDITSADIRDLLNQEMVDGYAYTTVKKVHVLLNEYFRYLTQQELIVKNPMVSTPMIKKSNFLAAQDREDLPEYDTVTVFTPDEIERFKTEAFRCYSNGKRVYQQAAAYILMLNTGLRTGELLGLLNSDIDLEHRVMHLNRGVKEVAKRDGVTAEHGREVKTGKLKSASSKRNVPLNDTAVAMIQDLRAERYMGEDTPLVCDENGNFTRPVNFRKRYYRVLQAAGIETKGLHALRHTFATNLVNGIRQPDGSIKALTPRQVADLLGHTTSQITEMYYVKKDTARLSGITDDFNI
jgi:Site-specific recombinase XerD